MPWGTFISCPQSNATLLQPNLRAAIAGYSALRSGEVVKIAEAISSATIPFLLISSLNNLSVAASISLSVLETTGTAPLTPLQTVIVPPLFVGNIQVCMYKKSTEKLLRTFVYLTF